MGKFMPKEENYAWFKNTENISIVYFKRMNH